MEKSSQLKETISRQVKEKRKATFRSLVDNRKTVDNRWITVAMVIENDIPSYLEVEGTMAVIKYRVQPKTCWICSSMEI